MKRVNVCVLRAAGTNCDKETAFAFSRAEAKAELIHINALLSGSKALDEYQILAIPGGFTYGDDLGAGKILANELRFKLKDSLERFIEEGKLIIGICNGFQILVKAGFLPGGGSLQQEASLIINDCAKFEDRWVYLKSQLKSVWTKGMPEVIYLPVAHGEGKFVVKNKSILARLKKNNQVSFRYCNQKGKPAAYPFNPNGSVEDIAGICDQTGRILGLMPHPERHIEPTQHPRWHTGKFTPEGDGLQIFKNGVNYAAKYL